MAFLITVTWGFNVVAGWDQSTDARAGVEVWRKSVSAVVLRMVG